MRERERERCWPWCQHVASVVMLSTAERLSLLKPDTEIQSAILFAMELAMINLDLNRMLLEATYRMADVSQAIEI